MDGHEWRASVGRMEQALVARSTGELVDAWEGFLNALEDLAGIDPYMGLTLAHGCLKDVEDLVLPDLVVWCRERGESWEDIGMALELSKQAAHRRYREMVESRESRESDEAAP